MEELFETLTQPAGLVRTRRGAGSRPALIVIYVTANQVDRIRLSMLPLGPWGVLILARLAKCSPGFFLASLGCNPAL